MTMLLGFHSLEIVSDAIVVYSLASLLLVACYRYSREGSLPIIISNDVAPTVCAWSIVLTCRALDASSPTQLPACAFIPFGHSRSKLTVPVVRVCGCCAEEDSDEEEEKEEPPASKKRKVVKRKKSKKRKRNDFGGEESQPSKQVNSQSQS